MEIPRFSFLPDNLDLAYYFQHNARFTVIADSCFIYARALFFILFANYSFKIYSRYSYLFLILLLVSVFQFLNLIFSIFGFSLVGFCSKAAEIAVVTSHYLV